MTQTITRLFDSYDDATRAVDDIAALGISHDDLSILGNRPGTAATDTHSRHDHADHNHDIKDVNDHGDVDRGATTGALLGGVGGLLAGLGLMAIPGLGPIVAAGWLAATVTGAGIGAAGGAATGGIVGALKDSGHSEDDANVYSEGIRRGGTLVSARVADEVASQVEAVMQRYHGSDATTRGTDYRAGGWSRFDENAPAYTGTATGSDTPRPGTRL